MMNEDYTFSKSERKWIKNVCRKINLDPGYLLAARKEQCRVLVILLHEGWDAGDCASWLRWNHGNPEDYPLDYTNTSEKADEFIRKVRIYYRKLRDEKRRSEER